VRAARWAVLAGALALVAAAARADDDVDLDRIPGGDPAEQQPAPAPGEAVSAPPATRLVRRVFLEDALMGATPVRAVPVRFPGTPPRWQNRSSLDGRLELSAHGRLTLTLSDRLSVVEQDGQRFGSRQTVRNDLREGYLTWKATPGAYLEAGRISVRNGAALGYNPTDFFRTRTLVGQASQDPSSIRQNRLGTVMARAQATWGWGSASLAYAPRLASPSQVTQHDPVGVDPRFDATNAAHRWLATLSADAGAWSPQLLGYVERDRSKVGVNLSRPIGEAVIVYAEWAGGPEANLVTRALRDGQRTGTLPPDARPALPTSTETAFRSDLAAGYCWTIGTTLTLNVEYHFHEAGFTRRDWHDWFKEGSAPGAASWVAPGLWFVRDYANDQQEPVARHQVFARVAWPKAIARDLEIDAFALVDAYDGSTLAQLSLSYQLSDTWTVAAYASANAGRSRSERGSVPQRGSAVLQLIGYL
jgi:hypothetical protein